jgi:hypothetical protein
VEICVFICVHLWRKYPQISSNWFHKLLKLIFVGICVFICVHLWMILPQISSNWFHKLLKLFFVKICVLFLFFLFINRGDGETGRFFRPSPFNLQLSPYLVSLFCQYAGYLCKFAMAMIRIVFSLIW